MYLVKCCVVLLSLIAAICASGVILKSAESNAAVQVDKAAFNIITTCYRHRGHAVGIGGNISEFLMKKLSTQQIPVVLVNNFTGMHAQDNDKDWKLQYKLQVFAVAASNWMELKKIILEIRNSRWWNHMASVLILYRSSKGCNGAQKLFPTLWYQYVVNAKLICSHNKRNTTILGYNPYATEAPQPWRRWVFTKLERYNNTFTVFKRSYQNQKNICKNLDFDKMKNTHLHPIQLIAIYDYNVKHKGGRNDYHQYKIFRHVLETIFSHVNGSTFIRLLPIGKNNSRLYVTSDVSFGTIPLSLAFHPTVVRARSPPIHETGLAAMTQPAGYKSQLEKILTVIDQQSRIGLYIVLAGTLIFFKFFMGQALIPGFLNIVRIVCNTGFTNLSQNTPTRLYLTTVLLFAVTMQGIYQGKLASLLTTEIPLPNVNTWSDLRDCSHIIYIPKGYLTSYFSEPYFKGRVIPLNNTFDCAQYVLDNSNAACANYPQLLMDQAENLDLHLSEIFYESLGTFTYRPTWPLAEKFDNLVQRIVEGDIAVPLHLRAQLKTLSEFNLEVEAKNDQGVRIMTLRDLTFAFVILGIGLGCATITFVFERVIHRNRVFLKKWLRKIGPDKVSLI